ncbi:MAG: hypothetical protein ABIV50_11825 [Opitutus sp.]
MNLLRPTAIVFAAWLLCLTGIVRAAEDLRLSVALLPDEREAAGLKALTSDQTAILDALVRRDIATMSRPAPAKETRAARFSERLTPDERTNSGLTLLSSAQVAQLNDYVARLSAPLDPGSRGGWSSTSRDSAVSVNNLRRGPEIHGSISLMFGVGSGGYSERGGAMVVSIEDPSGVSLAFGYSEIHTKGGYYPGYYRDGYCRDTLLGDDFGRRPW